MLVSISYQAGGYGLSGGGMGLCAVSYNAQYGALHIQSGYAGLLSLFVFHTIWDSSRLTSIRMRYLCGIKRNNLARLGSEEMRRELVCAGLQSE
jgi:hypothetical protein